MTTMSGITPVMATTLTGNASQSTAVQVLASAVEVKNGSESEKKELEAKYQKALIAQNEAQTALTNAQSELESAQSAYDKAVAAQTAAQSTYDNTSKEVSNAESSLATAKTKLASAQSAYDSAKSDYDSKQNKVSELQSQVEAQQKKVDEAQAAYDTALEDYNTTDLEKAQKALSDFETKNADKITQYASGVKGYYDSIGATRAASVVENPVGSSYTLDGETYYTGNGKLLGYTVLGDENDATNLKYVKKSIQYIRECNALRKENGVDELKVSMYLMAVAEVNSNWSAKGKNHSHPRAYTVSENIAWGYYGDAYSSDSPFRGWYDQEKACVDFENQYKTEHPDATSDEIDAAAKEAGVYPYSSGGELTHYYNIVLKRQKVTGFSAFIDTEPFATYNGEGYLKNCTCQTFEAWPKNDDVFMTVDEFEASLDAYIAKKDAFDAQYQALKDAVTNASSTTTKDDTAVKEAKSTLDTEKSTLSTLKNQLSAAQSSLSTANTKLSNTKSDLDSANSAVATAQTALSNKKTTQATALASLNTAKDNTTSATNAVSSKKSAVSTAKSTFDSKKAAADKLKSTISDVSNAGWGWRATSNGIQYVSANGNTLADTFWTVNDDTYYLDSNGCRVTGWKEINGKQYYFDSTGVLSETKDERESLDLLAKRNKSNLADGKYVIHSLSNSGYVLDVNGGSASDCANVQLYESNNSPAQAWKVTHDSQGYITFTNIGSGKVLDLNGASSSNGTNVQQYSSNGTYAQKWVAVKTSSGYKVVSALNKDIVLDIDAGNISNGANIQVWSYNDSGAQQWTFTKYQTAREELNELATNNKSSLSDGTYTINSISNSNYVLDVLNGSVENGANIQLYQYNGSGAQKWRVTHDATGYVTLTNVNSGKVLDANGGNSSNGTNLQQYESNGTYAQKWIIIKTSNGYKIVSALNKDIGLDIDAGRISNNSNIQLWTYNNSGAQQFTFSKA